MTYSPESLKNLCRLLEHEGTELSYEAELVSSFTYAMERVNYDYLLFEEYIAKVHLGELQCNLTFYLRARLETLPLLLTRLPRFNVFDQTVIKWRLGLGV